MVQIIENPCFQIAQFSEPLTALREERENRVPVNPDVMKTYLGSNVTGAMSPGAINGLTGNMEERLVIEGKLDRICLFHSQLTPPQLEIFGDTVSKVHQHFEIPIISEGSIGKYTPDELEELRNAATTYLEEIGGVKKMRSTYVLLDGLLVMPYETSELIWDVTKMRLLRIALEVTDWSSYKGHIPLNHPRQDRDINDLSIQSSFTLANAERVAEFDANEELRDYRLILPTWYSAIYHAIKSPVGRDILQKQQDNFIKKHGGIRYSRPTPELDELNNLLRDAVIEASTQLRETTGLDLPTEDEGIVETFLDLLTQRKEFSLNARK